MQSTVEEEALKALAREREDEAFFNDVTNSKLFEELIAKGLVNAARLKQMKETGANVDLSRLNEFDEGGLASVHRAAQMGYVRTLDRIFRLQPEQRELETQDDCRETPLLVAVKYQQPSDDTFKVMVDAGCNLAVTNSRNHGVVELSCLSLNADALRFFLALRSPQLPVWPKLLNFVASDLEDFSEKAGMCLAELTKPNEDGSVNEIWMPVAQAGGVAVLTNVTKGFVGDLAVAQALRCLINILRVAEVQRQIKAADGLPAIVRQLKSRSWRVIQLSAAVLATVCETEEYADEVCSLGGLPALVAVLRGTREADALASAVAAVGSLTNGSRKRQNAFHSTPDGVDAFCALFADCTHQPLLLALTKAVECVARDHRNNQDAIVRGGSVQLILLLCDIKHRPIQLNAVNAVRVLVEGNEAAQRAMTQEGAVMPLVQILRKTANQTLRECTARALWALAGDGVDSRRTMAACIRIETLIEFAGSLSETLHFVGSEGLGALAKGARSEQTAIADANGIHPVVRLLKSDKEYLVVSALRTIALLCLGVGFVPHKRNQDALEEARAVKLLATLITLSRSQRVQAEAAVALSAAALNNPGVIKDMRQPSQHVDFSFVLILKLLHSADEEVRLLAGEALATFAYNSVPNQQSISNEGGVRFQSFLPFLRSGDEIHRCKGAFQTVVLSRIFPDEEQAIASAAGIKVIVDILTRSSDVGAQALAADCVARLAHTRAGIPDAFVAIETVDMLCDLMLSPTEHVRGSAAIALSYLSYNHKAERLLLNRCRLDPYLTKCLLYYAGRPNIPTKFLNEWNHYKKVGLPPIPDGRPCLVNNQFLNPFPTAASRRMTAAESTDNPAKLDGVAQITPRSIVNGTLNNTETIGSTRRNSIMHRMATATGS